MVVFDAGVAPALLESVADSAERIRVGDDVGGVPRAAVPSVLAARATAGLRLARLVVGDATDFGEEAAAVVAAGVAVDVVPGVSGAVAGATYAGIPVARADGGASAVVLDATDPSRLDWGHLGGATDVLLIRVSGPALSAVIAELLRGGRRPESDAALIYEAGTFRQRTLTGRLDGLVAEAARAGLSQPALLIVGEVVRLRSRLAWLERRPLFGRRVLVTRPPGPSSPRQSRARARPAPRRHRAESRGRHSARRLAAGSRRPSTVKRRTGRRQSPSRSSAAPPTA